MVHEVANSLPFGVFHIAVEFYSIFQNFIAWHGIPCCKSWALEI